MASNVTPAQLNVLCDVFGYTAVIDGDKRKAAVYMGDTFLYSVEIDL